jgi:hypothetical protein
VAETSDVAYEKRHRKFENFEKRQRLREKEKLKHEHYKLKERIEQLRAMDGPNFMTLPSDAFTPAPQGTAEDVEETINSPYVSMTDGVSLAEGERRRKEMLDVAIMLEKRYAYLLPPRKLPEASSSILKDTESREGEETDTERGSGVPASKKDKVPKLRTQSIKSSASSTPAHSPRPLVPRKPWYNTTVLIPEPKGPSRSHGTSISTSAEAPDPILPVEEKAESPSSLFSDRLSSPSPPPPSQLVQSEKSASPMIIIDDIPETDGLPSQSPPTPTPVQSVWDKKSPSPDIVVGDSPETDKLPSPPPPPPPSQWSQNEELPSPDILAVDDVPRLPSQSPPPPPPMLFQSVRNDVGTPNIHSPEPPLANQFPLITKNGTQPEDEDVSMEISEESRSVDSNIEVEVSQPQPEPSPNMSHHMRHLENAIPADRESEQAPSATEKDQEPTAERGPEDLETKTAETTTEPVSTGEPEPPKRGRKRKWGRRKSFLPTRVAKRPETLQENVAGPSRAMEDEPEVVSGIRLEELPPEVGLTDSISARPVKRRRMYGEVVLHPESISAPPTVDYDREISITSFLKHGKTHVSYVDSRTGKKVSSPSLLMVACMRALEKAIPRRARETTSFGVPTPDFGKGTIVDYELQEDILYRDFMDTISAQNESSVASSEGSEQEQDSSDDTEDEQSEEESEESEKGSEESEKGSEESEKGSEESKKGSERGTEDETEDEIEEGQGGTEKREKERDETESENRPSPEVQLSNERDNHVESWRSAPEKPQDPVEAQTGGDQNRRGIKLTGQSHYPRYGRFLVYQGPHNEQLVASPEAELMPQVPPVVRPRERSRRSHCDLDEEQLLW